MPFLILKTAKSSFRSLFNPCRTCYLCFKDLNQKTFIVHQSKTTRRSSSYQTASNLKIKILKLKSVYCSLRNTTTDFNAPFLTSCLTRRKLSGRLVSIMDKDDKTGEVSQTSPSIDNGKIPTTPPGKNDEHLSDTMLISSSNNASNETIQQDILEKSKTVEEEDESSKYHSNANEDTKNEIKTKKKYVSVSVPMSKRALRKWRKQQRKGIEATGPLTTNPDPGYGSDVLSETEYYFENGLRKVYPYYHTFTSYVKGRWVGRTLLDVFTKEFHILSEENLTQDIQKGLLRVNDKIIPADYKLKFNDFMSHKIHRHENPVVDTKLEIIEDNEHVIVVNKPSSIPCHPCGRYRYNSIVFILGKEYKYSNLRNIYRLDRLTSGVLICAKTSEKTRELEDQILHKSVQKEYVSRVHGKFPDEEIEVDRPLECINHKISLWQIRESGKPSKTLFKRLSYNGKSSVVQCIPLTGRTHQIRVHLQYLGHPILNDPLYSSDAWGPQAGKGKIFTCTIEDQKIGEAVMKNHNIGLWEKGPHPLFQSRLQQVKEEEVASKATLASSAANSVSESHEREPDSVKEEVDPVEVKEPPTKRIKTSDEDLGLIKESRPGFNLQKWIPDENCVHCKTEYIDPKPKDLLMCLHALSYKGPDWEYRTSLPEWAQPDWQEENC